MPFETADPHPSYEDITVDDLEDKSYYLLLKRFPSELVKKHIAYIFSEQLDEDEATLYIQEQLHLRREAITVSHISDPEIAELFSGREKDIFSRIEGEIFNSKENSLGVGTTAHIKRMNITEGEGRFSMAIKYLITPNERTLSAAAEHDMIQEVERIEHIEELEKGEDFDYIGVPHPFFHHKNSSLQCYGMQLINGCDLEQGISTQYSAPEELLENIKNIDIEKLDKEVEAFFNKMHAYCLHGDIKAKNIMIDTDGKFYIIDFGQSVLVHEIPEKAYEQFENLKAQEIDNTKRLIRGFMKRILNN